MTELPRQSCTTMPGRLAEPETAPPARGLRGLRGWRRNERLVLLACVLFAVLEVLVVYGLAGVVEAAIAS